ncbi:hypothetical protein D3C71_1969060 [compost metagenome]
MIRDIFSELKDGLEALADERKVKVTLRTHKVKLPKLAPDTVEQLAALEVNHAVEAEQSRNQRIGTMKAKRVIPEHFDAPLPDDMLDDFEGSQI